MPATLMLGLDRHMTSLFSGMRMFALPVDPARQALGAIACRVISVGGVSFSVTMVALTLMSGQYGPKVLQHLLEDKDSKVSLGLFFLNSYVDAFSLALAGVVVQQLEQVVAVKINDVRLVGFVMQQDARLPGGFDDDDERVAMYLAMTYQLGGFTVHEPKTRMTPLEFPPTRPSARY